jgi:XRE family transcriptional regulator, aerobic/anaerobic benzoate catabolism transcriptional regulator
MQPDAEVDFLGVIADRVRDLRAKRGMTRRVLARDSGVSERYLAQLESGQGNPSITVIHALARAFNVPPTALIVDPEISPLASTIIATVREMDQVRLLELQRLIRTSFSQNETATRDRRIALIGLRGAGKTTIGNLLAQCLGLPFIELDREVERDAGIPLSEMFEFYGQAGFRRHERASLERLLDTESAFVLATSGSIVSESSTFERLLTACFTVWLTATPAEHMERVVAQGDMRPMAGNPHAMTDLRNILAGRDALHRRADIEVSTSNRSAQETLDALVAALPQGATVGRVR